MSSRDKKTLKPSSSRTGSGRIRGLADLNRPSADHDSDTDPDVPQEYYTGGEKRSFSFPSPSFPSAHLSLIPIIIVLLIFLLTGFG